MLRSALQQFRQTPRLLRQELFSVPLLYNFITSPKALLRYRAASRLRFTGRCCPSDTPGQIITLAVLKTETASRNSSNVDPAPNHEVRAGAASIGVYGDYVGYGGNHE